MNEANPALPPWCAPSPEAIPREGLVADALAAVEGEGHVWLRGAPAAGTSTALGGVACALIAGGRCAAAIGIRAHSELRFADAMRAIAVQVGTFPAARAHGALQARPYVIIVDDADLAASTVDALRAALPGAVWLFGGRLPGDGLVVDSVAKTGETPEEPPGIELYGGVPMGVAGQAVAGWAPWLVPQPGRIVLRRSVAERLGGGLRAEALAASLRDDLQRVHELACDVASGHDPDDIVWLRACAERIADPDLAAISAAAAARLFLRWGALEEAQAVIAVGRSHLGLGGAGAAVLLWLEGDLRAARGAADDAEVAHQRALEWFVGAGLLEPAGALSARNAEELVRRGFSARSRRWSVLARESFSVSGQPTAWSDTLRVAAEAAAAAGEIVGAASLLDEAAAVARRGGDPSPTRVSIALARAGLEVARGATSAAEDLITAVEADAEAEPTLIASIAWRRAELEVRRNHREQAALLLAAAHRGYVNAGNLRGLRLVDRLDGDRRALDGDLDGAVHAWSSGLAAALADHDLEGARRLLRRMLAVERHTEAAARAEDLRERLSSVEAALRMR